MNEPRPPLRRRARRLAGSALLATALGGALSACGSDANALGHQACVEVARSLATLRSAAHARTPVARTRLEQRAGAELRAALQPAALAGSTDGDWQALEATLSETGRVPETNLVDALEAQCAATLSG